MKTNVKNVHVVQISKFMLWFCANVSSLEDPHIDGKIIL
jgi:hypothetical protein